MSGREIHEALAYLGIIFCLSILVLAGIEAWRAMPANQKSGRHRRRDRKQEPDGWRSIGEVSSRLIDRIEGPKS